MSGSDYYSPEQRLARYRQELMKRIPERMMYVALLGFFLCQTLPLFEATPSRGGLICAFLLVPILLASGDFYELLRSLIEARLFCPSYDKASQPRPKFQVDPNRIDVLCFRLSIYLIAAPLLPTAFLVIVCYCGVIHLPAPIATAWAMGMMYALFFGTLRVFGWQAMTLREWCKPFKQVPRPDIN
jgi:hypothetical protein